ncbi:hypothetical protein BOX15_Mlig009118g2 [Macrostomum lignano]|uniref:Transmembrane protein n=1 Tax=Macrostomum lignano TaxID=282301 RepID=A0A267GWM6_9PLAT|nr:hypothetical protein BOX15_Mlig009118g2 [Macrostomum lignano]
MAASGAVCCILAITCTIAAVDLGLSIAEIAMGYIHLQDCPVQAKIPIYLVVAGCTGLILALGNFVKAKKTKGDSQRREAAEQSTASNCANGIISLLSLFAFVWLICGTVWVFSTSPTFQQAQELSNATTSTSATTAPALVTVPEASNSTSPVNTYCYEPLYKFVMATVLLRYAVMGLYLCLILCTCCACCGAMCCVKFLVDKEDGASSGERQEQAVSMVEKS